MNNIYKRKLGVISTVALLLSASFSQAATHVDANHCEIYVDRIGISSDVTNYDSRWVHIYLKALPDRLNGDIKEIGGRLQTTILHAYGRTVKTWENLKTYKVNGAKDFVEVPFRVSEHQYNIPKYSSREIHEVAFYVRTDKDTYYWIKDEAQKNFIINENTYMESAYKLGFGDQNHPGYAPLENSHVAGDKFNPSRCY